jgi:hypothetical protein
VPAFLKTAKNVVERVEEYRLHSSAGDLQNIALRNLAVRLNAFYRAFKKANPKPPANPHNKR